MKFLNVVLSALLLLTANFAYSSTAFAEKVAVYEITFVNQWNQMDHLAFPANAHYSPLVAVSHNRSYELFAVGKLVTPEFEQLAETGATQAILQQLKLAIQMGGVMDIQTTPALFPHRDGHILKFMVTVSQSAPLLSFATMIAPSPDWVIGVSNLNTFDGKDFIADGTMDLIAINAGTEEGDFGGNFSIRNRPTSPHMPASYLNNKSGLMKPFAKVLIQRVK